MTEMMQLVVGWTLVGAFGFTVLLTCLSLPGWIRFADKGQQRKLFAAVIVEVVVVFGANAAGVVRLDAEEVKEEIKTKGSNDAVVGILGDLLKPAPGAAPNVTKEQAEQVVDRLKVEKDPEIQRSRKELQDKVRALPPGKLSPQAVQGLKPAIDRSRLAPLRLHK